MQKTKFLQIFTVSLINLVQETRESEKRKSYEADFWCKCLGHLPDEGTRRLAICHTLLSISKKFQTKFTGTRFFKEIVIYNFCGCPENIVRRRGG